MENRDTILNELEGVTPLLASLEVHTIMPFKLPHAGYFEELADQIMAQIAEVQAPIFTDLPLSAPPAGYFDGLASQILSKINTSSAENDNEVFRELEQIAPLLNTISKKNIYSVSAGYFDTIGKGVISAKGSAKVISFRKTRNWISYAAASVIGCVLVSGAFLFSDKQDDNSDYFNYHKVAKMDLHKELHKLGDDELQKYLDNARPISNIDVASSVNDSDLPDIEENLKMVSDEELKQYLKENEGPEVKTTPGS